MTDERLTDERLAKLHIALELCIRLSEESEPVSVLSITRKGLQSVFEELKAARVENAALGTLLAEHHAEILRLEAIIADDGAPSVDVVYMTGAIDD